MPQIYILATSCGTPRATWRQETSIQSNGGLRGANVRRWFWLVGLPLLFSGCGKVLNEVHDFPPVIDSIGGVVFAVEVGGTWTRPSEDVFRYGSPFAVTITVPKDVSVRLLVLRAGTSLVSDVEDWNGPIDTGEGKIAFVSDDRLGFPESDLTGRLTLELPDGDTTTVSFEWPYAF